MRVAIYTIAKDEEQDVRTFMDHAKEADKVFLLDTGSQDHTIEIAKECGAEIQQQIISPWRFDTARNVALAMVPKNYDICIALDLDERPDFGWRKILENFWTANHPTQVSFKFIYNHNADGSPGYTFMRERIHSRHDYKWRRLVHEVLFCLKPETHRLFSCENMIVHHWQKPKSTRSNYLPLMKRATEEDPQDTQMAFWYGRDLYCSHFLSEAKTEFIRYITLTSSKKWSPERAAVMCFLGRCYEQEHNDKDAEYWYLKATIENGDEREPWMTLAKFYNSRNKHSECYSIIHRVLSITNRAMHYIVDDSNWKDSPWDLLAVSAWYLGHKEEAKNAAIKAYELNPHDARIKSNYNFIMKAYPNERST